MSKTGHHEEISSGRLVLQIPMKPNAEERVFQTGPVLLLCSSCKTQPVCQSWQQRMQCTRADKIAVGIHPLAQIMFAWKRIAGTLEDQSDSTLSTITRGGRLCLSISSQQVLVETIVDEVPTAWPESIHRCRSDSSTNEVAQRQTQDTRWGTDS